MTRRRYQQGYVFQKGRKREDEWLPETPAYVQYWRDIPGQPQRRAVIALGACRTRTIADRLASERLEQLGINSTQHFIESTSTVTFRQQGETWLRALAARKRNPLEQSTIYGCRSTLDKWLYPFMGALTLGEVNNRTMKELVEHLVPTLQPGTIREYLRIAKSVVSSAIDENGEEIFPRKWNEEYIDAPIVRDQRQPTITSEGIVSTIAGSDRTHSVLYGLLAGCGPLRIGEAVGLDISQISEDFRTLRICQKAKRGVIQMHLKTEAGAREIDLCQSLADMLREYVGDRREGLVFLSARGRPLNVDKIRMYELQPILESLNLPIGGFNIFRRFRMTHLETHGCPSALMNFWAGHAPKHVSEVYIKLRTERAYRLEWAERLGTGFNLTGQPGLLRVVQNVA